MTASAPFEIQVAVLGCNYASKATVLNGLLGDEYLPHFGEAAAHSGVVDSFRIVESANENIHSKDWVSSTITDRALASANASFAHSKAVVENEFNVVSMHDLTRELRDDSTLVFVNIPSFDRGGNPSTGESFFLGNLKRFDRAIVVVDPFEDNENDFASLLQSLKTFLKKKPSSSIAMVCNVAGKGKAFTKEIAGKINRLKEQVRSINNWAAKEREETLVSREESVLPIVAPIRASILSYDSDDDDIAVSSFECAGSANADIHDESMSLAIDFIESPLSGDFDDELIQKVRDIVGNVENQTELLKEQRAAALGRLDAVSPFTKALFTTCERYLSLEANGAEWTSSCVEKFWKLYSECEDHAISKFETEMDPCRLALPMEQLVEFKVWVDKLEMEEEIAAKLEAASRNLIKQQLRMVLHKNSLWSFDDWYGKMNTNEWKRVTCQDWLHVSPSDWNTIISSLLLVSSDCYFYESFGKEKIMLERARFLSGDRLVKADSATGACSNQFSAADGCPSLEHSLDGSYEKGRFRPRYPTTFDCVVRFEVPDKLSHKKHWGHIAWKYCNLMRSLER